MVVTLLKRSRRCIPLVGAHQRAASKADAGADRGALAAADQSAGGSADRGADHGALRRAVAGGLFGGFSADLRMRKAAAFLFVETELVEVLAGAGKHQDPGAAGRGRGATREQQC